MTSKTTSDNKMLLHACCGPCSLEPVRILREEGIEPTIFYSNSNIAPEDEYAHRLSTISDWAKDEDLKFVEGAYEPEAWKDACASFGDAAPKSKEREERCRQCYRLRFEATASYAHDNGFDIIGTTLSVSPYQFTEIIREELEKAADKYQLESYFVDYSPYYRDATSRSIELGMYRQKYCGCAFSKSESEEQQRLRAERLQAERKEKAQKRAEQEKVIAARKNEKAAYDKKQARKRAILKQLREERSSINHE